MTSKPQDAAGAEMNRLWRKQQAVKITQQKPVNDVHQAPPAGEKTAVIHPATPKPVPEPAPKIGNAICMTCAVMLPCRTMWKSIHRKKHPKPDVITATVRFVDEHGPVMNCLSGVCSDE